MQVDFSTVLKDVYGKDLERIKTPAKTHFVDGREIVDVPAELEPMQAGHAAIDALMAGDAQEKDGNVKVKAFRLALLIAAGPIVELKADQIVLLKDKVAAVWAPVVCGRMYDLLGE